MNLSWVLPRSWLRRRRPAAQPQTEQPQPDSGLPSWRRLPVLTATGSDHRPVTGDGRAAVAGTRSLLARPAGPPGRPLVRGRSDALVTASPLRPSDGYTPDTADNGGAAVSGGAVSADGAVTADGGGKPTVTAYRAVPVADAAPRRLPVLPETPAERRPRADLTRATAESVGMPRPVTPPPPRSEFAQRLDAFRPDWLRAEIESDLPHYVRARAADIARSGGPAAAAAAGPAMPRPGSGFSPPGRIRPASAGPAGARTPSGAAAGPDRPDAAAVSRPSTVFRRTVRRGADGTPRSGSGSSGTVPSAEQSHGEDAPEGDGAPPSGRPWPDTERHTREDGPHSSSGTLAVPPAAPRSERRPSGTAGPATGDAEATAAREGVQGPAAGEAPATPGGPRGYFGPRGGGAGGPGVQEVPGIARALRHAAASGRPSSRAQDAHPAENASAPVSVPGSARPAGDRVVPPPPFAAARPGGLSEPDAEPSDASARIPSQGGEFAAPDAFRRPDGSGAADRSTVPAEPQVQRIPRKPRRGITGGAPPAAAHPSRPPGKQHPGTAATPSNASGAPAVPPAAPAYAAAPPDHRAPGAAPRYRLAIRGADHPVIGPVTHTPGLAPTDHGPTSSPAAPAPHAVAGRSPGGAVVRDADAARPAESAKGATVAVLAPHLAHRFERELGMPVSGVVVRRDAEATVRAKRLGARAFTENGTVFLPEAAGPVDGPDGGALLTHELVHAVQQATRPVVKRTMGEEDAAMEAEAVMAERWARGHPVRLRHPRLAAAPPPPPPAVEQAGDVVQRAPLAAPPSADAAAPADPHPAGHGHLPVTGAAQAARYREPRAERPAQWFGARFPDGSLEARLAELAEAVTGLRRRRCVQLDHPVHLDALADLLYERVAAHLRREMVVERERHGLLTFPA
ncbi:DUF4157 domain-containing protein [Streptomyces griseofuscus]|uniref:eCIS core domain-containing protein n=1 Tax=Streptomyces griseofuscus TaxID=146922 RepID=UPI0036BBED86